MSLWTRRRPVLCRGCATPTDGEHALAQTDPAGAAAVEAARVVLERWQAHGRRHGYVLVADVFGDSLADLEQAFQAIDSPNGDVVPRPVEEPVP